MNPVGIGTLIKIVEAGIEVFAEEGPYGANTIEIAERAGVAESTIFRRFETKDDLLRECLRVVASRSLDPAQFEAIIFKGAAGEQEFSASVLAAMNRWYGKLPVSAARLVLYTSLSRSKEWHVLGSERTTKIIAILADRIEQEARRRHIRKLDSEAAATSLIAALLYLKSTRSGARERDPQLVETVVRQWMFGLFAE